MRTTDKILLLFLPTFLLSVVMMTLLSRRAAESVLIGDVARSGRTIGTNLTQSSEMVEGFRRGDESLLLPPLRRAQANTEAEYTIILGPQRRVLAHTNVLEKDKIYDDGISRRAVEAVVPLQEEVSIDGHRVMDVSYPVWEVDRTDESEAFLLLGPADRAGQRRLATIRLGLPLDRAFDTADRISNQVMWIVTVINVLAMGVTLFCVRRILLPVQQMAAATERIAAGDLGQSVPVLSHDEIGELAHSFNRMSRELATTTVSVDFLDNILDNMRDVLIVTHADGSVRRVNRAALALLCYEVGDVIGRSASHLFAEGSGGMFSAGSVIDLTRAGGMDARELALVPGNGEPIAVVVSVATFRDRGGAVAGFIITAADITERKRAETRIRQSLEEKQVLLKEIHHRVRNNLQIISSLLNLQASKTVDAEILALFADSRNRVQSMALLHEKLYQSNDLARVDFRDYLQSLAMTLYQSYLHDAPSIVIDVEVDEGIRLGIDQAIPCGLIVNELVSNSLKHAFADGLGRVTVRFGRLATATGRPAHRLVVEDDGTGLPADADMRRAESLGLKLVTTLAQQLHATVTTAEVPGGARPGTRYTIEFDDRIAGV
ncbi:MAG: HAMP domain-containing protein [bacterium]|nr:HAMP domain-containing protein [bacterium]